MNKLLVPALFLVVAYGLFFGYLAETYRELPAKVACHFDNHGQPNGWMSRRADAEILSVVALLVPALVIGTMGAADRIPLSFINLPHREYWLSPERRRAVLSVLRRYALWFATANVLFLTNVLVQMVEANLNTPHNLDMSRFTNSVILYLVLTSIWTFLLLRRFSRL